MDILTAIIIATSVISLGSFAGILTLWVHKDKLTRVLLLMVSFSAGALSGGAFLHLLPEAAETIDHDSVYLAVLASFVFFFLVEKILHWRHCHKGECDIHSFGYMNLFGDSIHNFIDGLIIAGTFLTDFRLGVITTLAVALHEIPQEIGDFGVLIYAGFEKKKAIIYNFLVATTVVLGGISGYILSFMVHRMVPFFLPLAAGGFIYIAASDLIPEIRIEKNLKKSVLSFVFFISGILMMYFVKQLEIE